MRQTHVVATWLGEAVSFRLSAVSRKTPGRELSRDWIPAFAGMTVAPLLSAWIPAFAGMTVAPLLPAWIPAFAGMTIAPPRRVAASPRLRVSA